MHDAGFTRNEAGKLLRLTFPEVKSRSIADKLTTLYGRSYSRVSVVPNALFYLTSPPPERLLEGELREETRRNALARLRKATQSSSADGTFLTYEAADSTVAVAVWRSALSARSSTTRLSCAPAPTQATDSLTAHAQARRGRLCRRAVY